MPNSAVPGMHGLSIEAVEWLPSGAESDLVRVRGRWAESAQTSLPALIVRADGRDHRFASLPDARFVRDPLSWRGSYLVPSELVAGDPEALWVEWPGGGRAGLPAMTRGIEPPGDAPEKPTPPVPASGGQVIDRGVLAERRARRAEASEQAQARVAAEALKAVEALELRSSELSRRLDEATAERDALASASTEPPPREREALAAALSTAAELRVRAGEWQRRLHAAEIARTSDATRLRVLESAHASAGADRQALNRAEAAALAAGAELERARAATASDLESARGAWELRRGELDGALAGARAELAAAREDAARRGAGEEAETVARAALEDELDRERAAGEPLTADLAAALRAREAAETGLAALRGDLAAASAARETASAALAMAEMEVDELRAELEAERAARIAAEEALGLATAEADLAGATLQDRIAELQRRAAPEPDRLERLARAQAEAAASREAPAANDLAARLDAAAAALRDRAPDDTPPAADESPPAADDSPPAAERGDRLLRGAVVKLAHDDPVAAGRLLAGLLPAQGAVIGEALAYDLTIREVGTFGIDIAGGAASANPLERPRPRREAAFHLTADALTLAELLAGADHRIGRFRGPARIRGKRRRHKPLRALATVDLSLTAASRAGAQLEPSLAWQALAHAVHPSWTGGLVFSVASTTDDDTWYLTARDGGGLAASSASSVDATATVVMSRGAFDRLLREEPHPPGDRPAIGGDHAAVAALLGLISRARG